ncbi:hypothetical protein [Thermococcus sp.]|uniref:hypothetical protein n=1 Tax=Thermococcus sp. TaxID=35749 RepID=UPI0025FF36EA|nr:hypothetical protein [Thermococcus sp.]
MTPVEYILGAGYGLSLWLITSGIIKYLKEPKTFSFVLKKDTLSPVPEEKLPEEVRAYKDWLEESFKRCVLEKNEKKCHEGAAGGVRPLGHYLGRYPGNGIG